MTRLTEINFKATAHAKQSEGCTRHQAHYYNQCTFTHTSQEQQQSLHCESVYYKTNAVSNTTSNF